MTENELRSLPPLNLPYAPLKIAKDNKGNLKVFDFLRKKIVALTPEEFVRQNFISWLIKHRSFPVSLMANEVEIILNNTKKRCDTVVYGRQCEPLVIVEYKAPNVEITQNTFDQIVRYNRELKAKYLVVTNGIKQYCCKIDYANDSYNFIRVIPSYNEIVSVTTEN